MKKSHPAIALGLATALSLVLAACGSAPTGSASSSGGSGTASDFKACMVSDKDGFDDRSLNQSGKESLDRAGADFGIETVAVQSASDADYHPISPPSSIRNAVSSSGSAPSWPRP